jgi:hypothetical protein
LKWSKGIVVAGFVLCLWSCGLISMQSLSLLSYPAVKDQVISSTDALTISFSIPPDHAAAERMFRVSAPAGAAPGDLSWDGDKLVFSASPPLPRGQRLVLSLSGQLDMADGRSFTVAVLVPFFVETDAAQPRLLDHRPAEGEVVSVSTPLVLTFSGCMDPATLEDGFTLNPTAEFDISWDTAGKVATIVPRTQWSTLSYYQWELGSAVAGVNGVAISDRAEGSFLVQEDAAAPRLSGAPQPALLAGGAFLPLGGTLDDLRVDDCILFTFSEDVTIQSLQSALSFEPSIQGHLTRVRAGVFAFVPEQSYAMNTPYRLRISTDLTDLAGTRMAADYHLWFTPAIPVQRVLSITPGADPPVSDFNSTAPLDVALPPIPGDELTFIIVFEQPMDGASRARTPGQISLERFFPSSLLDPSLKSAAWTNDATLVLVFAGLQASSPPVLNHYRLVLPGGQNGLVNAEGAALEDDVWLLMIAR